MKVQSQVVSINGPAGHIEALLDLPLHISESPFISVNCHPHSLHGGSMTNKVVHTLSRSIAGLGIPSLRFNFRGVGKSEGEYDEGRGEQLDLAAAVNWANINYPARRLILSGFSFGAYVSGFAAADLNPSMLLSVAPPVKRFDFNLFQRPACDWSVIMGDKDELVDYADVSRWVKHFDDSPDLITMSGASHFFHGRLIELRQQVEKLVANHLLAVS